MKTLGKYECIEQLGAGSMGTVWRARDTKLDREVALKTILQGNDFDQELKERFEREARSCAQLQHHAIVTVYDFGDADGVAYIAMELLRGADLRRIIDERRVIPLTEKLAAMAQVFEGLAHAHLRGIIHRDMKPSNIFLMAEDGA